MKSCAVVGIDWGDREKDRMVDLLTRDHDAAARYQGGRIAGHTGNSGCGKFALYLECLWCENEASRHTVAGFVLQFPTKKTLPVSRHLSPWAGSILLTTDLATAVIAAFGEVDRQMVKYNMRYEVSRLKSFLY